MPELLTSEKYLIFSKLVDTFLKSAIKTCLVDLALGTDNNITTDLITSF